MKSLIPAERIEKKIYLIRGCRVIIDKDLAEFYGVSTKRLNEQVKRNKDRFPADFMFSLDRNEITRMSQFATSSPGIKFSKSVNVFTEHGVAMLSSVLRSERAIKVNIIIVRAFIGLRRVIESSKIVSSKVREHDVRLLLHDKKLKEHEESITAVVAHLMSKQKTKEEKKKFGFKP